MQKNIILMGPPGSGKGTLATQLKETLKLTHISTGDMFREAIAKGTELGKLAASLINSGHLVPDDVTVQLVKERLMQPDCDNGFLLDGFPRTIPQAEAFEIVSKEINRPIDVVINLECDDEELKKRITGRMVCDKCGAPYSLRTFTPKIEGKCDICSGTLIKRKDDNAEAFEVRLHHYNVQTKPLLDFYKSKGLLKSFNALNAREVVFDEVKAFLQK